MSEHEPVDIQSLVEKKGGRLVDVLLATDPPQNTLRDGLSYSAAGVIVAAGILAKEGLGVGRTVVETTIDVTKHAAHKAVQVFPNPRNGKR